MKSISFCINCEYIVVIGNELKMSPTRNREVFRLEVGTLYFLNFFSEEYTYFAKMDIIYRNYYVI